MNSENTPKSEKLNKIKPKVNLNNLKSDYFLIIIFDIMKKDKKLIILL